jgi:hypothetical protein
LEGPFQLTQVYFCQRGEASGIGDPDLSGAAEAAGFRAADGDPMLCVGPDLSGNGEEIDVNSIPTPAPKS